MQIQVRALHRATNNLGHFPYLLQYVLFDSPVSCSSDGQNRGVLGESGQQSDDAVIVWAKIMAPGGDTVCFIDDDHADTHFGNVGLPVEVIQTLWGDE